MNKKTKLAVNDVLSELNSASSNHPSFNSAHEGFAVLLEEVDELWDEVKKRPSKRKLKLLRAEAVQVSAMGLRFIIDCATRS